jgi:hypothetical protein
VPRVSTSFPRSTRRRMVRSILPRQPPQPIPELSGCVPPLPEYVRLNSPVPGIERVLTIRPRLSRPIRKPRNPHETPAPLFERFSRKPPGSRCDRLYLHAKLYRRSAG